MADLTATAPAGTIALRERRRTLAVLTACHTVNDFYNLFIPPLLPALYAAFGLSHAQGGALQFLATGVSALVQPNLGYFADRRSWRRRVLVGGFLVYALAAAWFSFSASYGTLIVGAIILGLGASAYHPQSATFLVYYFRDNRGWAQGIHGIGNALGFISAPIVVATLAYWYGWQWACLILALPGLVAAALAWSGLREPVMTASAGLLAGITRPLLLLTVITGTLLGVQSGFLTHLPSYYSAQGYSLFIAGTLTTVNSGAAIFAQPLGGTLSDRLGRRNVIAVSLAGAGCFLVFFLLAPLESLAILSSLLLGFFASLAPPVMMVYASELAAGERTGTAVGVVWGLGTLISALSPLVTGAVIDRAGFLVAYGLLAALAFLGGGLALLLPGRAGS